MNKVFLLIGGNIGDRLSNLSKARIEIEKSAGVIIKQSAIYETEAWGITDQPTFLNQVLLIETTLSAGLLLSKLLLIESAIGRKRAVKLGPRLIDLDILFFNNEIIYENDLVIPHPQLQNRRFTLVPLCEIEPHFKHPVLHKSIKDLLAACADTLEVKPLQH